MSILNPNKEIAEFPVQISALQLADPTAEKYYKGNRGFAVTRPDKMEIVCLLDSPDNFERYGDILRRIEAGFDSMNLNLSCYTVTPRTEIMSVKYLIDAYTTSAWKLFLDVRLSYANPSQNNMRLGLTLEECMFTIPLTKTLLSYSSHIAKMRVFVDTWVRPGKTLFTVLEETEIDFLKVFKSKKFKKFFVDERDYTKFCSSHSDIKIKTLYELLQLLTMFVRKKALDPSYLEYQDRIFNCVTELIPKQS